MVLNFGKMAPEFAGYPASIIRLLGGRQDRIGVKGAVHTDAVAGHAQGTVAAYFPFTPLSSAQVSPSNASGSRPHQGKAMRPLMCPGVTGRHIDLDLP